MRRLALSVGALVLLGASWAMMTDAGQLFLGRWSFTRWAYVDRGTYFRLKIDLTYQGAPQHFDIVVGCNVHGIEYKDGSSTREVGLVPTVYGRRMSDGKGLVVRAPDACDGETSANGKVPADFMPVMVVYDDASRLDFGTAYIADEAYDSPLSLMKFDKATVEAATRAEFDDFREKGPPNLVTRAQYHSIQSDSVLAQMALKRVWPAFARMCWARQRFRVPEAVKSELARFQPVGKPRYWGVQTAAQEQEAFSVLRHQLRQRDDGGEARSYDTYVFEERIGNNGVPRRGGGGTIGGKRYAPSFYPVTSALSADKWPSVPDKDAALPIKERPVRLIDVHVDDGRYRGFAYCYNYPASGVFENSDYLEVSSNVTKMVDDISISGIGLVWLSPDLYNIYEEDSYYFLPFSFYIDSTRGDV